VGARRRGHRPAAARRRRPVASPAAGLRNKRAMRVPSTSYARRSSASPPKPEHPHHAAADAADIAVQRMGRIIASQFPGEAGDQAALGVRFGTVPADQISAIVKRTTQQVTKLTWPIVLAATDAMKRELVRGVAMGLTTRVRVRPAPDAAPGGPASTAAWPGAEHRPYGDPRRAPRRRSGEPGGEQRTLAGWVWLAKLDARTCPSCWAQHGRLHPLEEPGPLDHQSGRCADMPKTKSWKELGFDVPEPPDVLPEAEETFAGCLPLTSCGSWARRDWSPCSGVTSRGRTCPGFAVRTAGVTPTPSPR
jgi:hypothetical protein